MRYKAKKTKYSVYTHKENGIFKNYKQFFNEKEAYNYMREIKEKFGKYQIEVIELELDGHTF